MVVNAAPESTASLAAHDGAVGDRQLRLVPDAGTVLIHRSEAIQDRETRDTVCAGPEVEHTASATATDHQ